MKNVLAGSLLLLALAWLPAVPPAEGCTPVTMRGKSVRIASESALILHDEKTQTEHFVRRGSFRTDVPYFGFLVPTPTEPTLGEAPDALFTDLEDWTKPEVKTEVRVRYRNLFGGLLGLVGQEHSKTMVAGAAPEVAVVSRQRIGNVDATVLKASDSEKLARWLEEHHYDARPAVKEWLGHYVKAGWYVTAFQMVKPEEKLPGLDSTATVMTFRTARPFYPYKEPSDLRDGTAGGGARSLRVFFVGTRRMAGALDDVRTAWPGAAAWANPLEEPRVRDLETRLAESKGGWKEKITLPPGAWLTVFDDNSYPRPGTADLFFSPASDQSARKRPPLVHYRYVVRNHPGELAAVGGFGAAVVLGGAFLLWKAGLRRPS